MEDRTKVQCTNTTFTCQSESLTPDVAADRWNPNDALMCCRFLAGLAVLHTCENNYVHYQLLKIIILNLSSLVLLAQLENIGPAARVIRKLTLPILPNQGGQYWMYHF